MSILGDRGEAQARTGREQRKAVPRGAHEQWSVTPDRPDPIALLRGQDADRVDDLVPIRWGRMSISPFAFYRGSAALMAADLSSCPRTELTVQLCGDAHLSNFGVYGSPERSLLFDVNDFDETLPGPFEWDLKRLAASFAVAARDNGFDDEVGQEAAATSARAYRQHIQAYAEMRELDVWYARVAAEDLVDLLLSSGALKARRRERAMSVTETRLDKARRRDSVQAAEKLTEVVDGRRRIVDQPPLIRRFEELSHGDVARDLFRQYVETLPDDRRTLVDRFEIIDVAMKVVGVGSVGTRCFIVLLAGRDQDDPLLLQVKEATRSVLEPHLGASRYGHAGQRVVSGQRLTQAATDIFLGWMTGQPGGRHFYWRQLRDMKGSIDVAAVRPGGLQLYAEVCGWALARGHARTGQRRAIAAYLGNGDRFERAIAGFAKAYADQTERDYEDLLHAIRVGRVPVETGV
jgi:uncharacterized protein (DUF2252 family)